MNKSHQRTKSVEQSNRVKVHSQNYVLKGNAMAKAYRIRMYQALSEASKKLKVYADRNARNVRNAHKKTVLTVGMFLEDPKSQTQQVPIITHPSVRLDLESNDELTVVYDDAEGNRRQEQFVFHTTHYGKRNGDDWSDREANSPFASLFRIIQREMKQKGYYLLDISDPTKGNKLMLILSIGKPDGYDDYPELWHGFNKLP